MADTEHLLSREQVAALLAVSVRSVRRYTDSGRLPSVHVGRNVRYRRADVERLIAEEVATEGRHGPQGGHVGPCPVEPMPLMATHGHDEPGAVKAGQEGPQVAANGHGPPEGARDTHRGPAVASNGSGVASPLAEVSLQAVEALRELLAAVQAENSALREEVAKQAAEVARKAEAAGMWQGRARTLEEQLRQLTAGQPAPEAAPAAPGDAAGAHRGEDTPRRPAGLWRRLRRALGGA